jgi:hypothetical protein
LSEKCIALANKWIHEKGEGCSAADLKDFRAKQTMFFLDTLITKATPMSSDLLAKLESCYQFTSSPNVEIFFRYLQLSLKSKHAGALAAASDFLGKYGRGLYLFTTIFPDCIRDTIDL